MDSALIAGENRELRLYRRGDEFSMRIPGLGELMCSRTHGSEDALGELTCQRLGNRPAPHLLVGGLGMGFTLAAALGRLGPDATVVVAELVAAVVVWNAGPLGECAGRPLLDRRVCVVEADVGTMLRKVRDTYDAVLLDVDNGPEGLTRRANDRLYSLAGLAHVYHALKPHGTLAVWSPGPDRAFAAALRKTGFTVEESRVRAHGTKGSRQIIWFAQRGA